MSLSYARLRQLHFRRSLAERFRGMAKTAVVGMGFFGSAGVFAIVSLMVVLADGLMALMHTHVGLSERLGILLGWQCVTLELLWLLHGAIFMRDAEPFLATLPIPDAAVWRADLRIVMQCYSVLWLPLIWLLYMLWSQGPSLQAVSASVSYLVMVGAGMVLNVLLLRNAYRRAAVMVLPMLVLMVFRPQSVLGAVAMLVTAAVAMTFAVRPRRARFQALRSTGRSRAIFERIALASALVVPASWHALRESLVVRGGYLLGAWALAMTLLAGHAPSVGLATALLIGLMAIASAALYRLPVLVRGMMLERLDFLAGHCAFRRRVTWFAVLPPVVLFSLCMSAYWQTAVHALPPGTSHAALPSYPLLGYAGLFAVGAFSANWTRDTMRWLMPTAHVVLTLIFLTVALS
ncbi:hypothetical protein GCM10027285_21490 [Oleiagrimonas citrea]|uniref:Uncharacterized protein n=1 Tax=Oleiagrimonas citrea TaxID=1665687 RepID=A0A846ZII4_9GAMM|nr:hypothetical protein [Oleiagrimonas citrea]NKZ37537.1 hypothetical protein [Oleiagrimonas citrea]